MPIRTQLVEELFHAPEIRGSNLPLPLSVVTFETTEKTKRDLELHKQIIWLSKLPNLVNA